MNELKKIISHRAPKTKQHEKAVHDRLFYSEFRKFGLMPEKFLNQPQELGINHA